MERPTTTGTTTQGCYNTGVINFNWQRQGQNENIKQQQHLAIAFKSQQQTKLVLTNHLSSARV
jgi:hypothetical protein